MELDLTQGPHVLNQRNEPAELQSDDVYELVASNLTYAQRRHCPCLTMTERTAGSAVNGEGQTNESKRKDLSGRTRFDLGSHGRLARGLPLDYCFHRVKAVDVQFLIDGIGQDAALC
jgi:hypothetical protein